MTNCELCGEDLFGADHHDLHDIGKESVFLCRDCWKDVENHLEKGDGKYVVIRCKECRHIKGIKFIKYKTRGRPKGSKTDPIKVAKRKGIRPLF